ncbi:cold-shock protein [Flagellimonas lutaonensis]|uniref:Cold-shock protein n=2 Tax=Flagellimonas lutaonensis TaxID=516051 RepID=A0A0D5YTG3_9FLAO|nr:cold-shock protein [Allomuricauda lutaonensis]|tara:strand:+ start:1338 stop:1571 length:234 start_codon:yes stop_codon:yes gene_type:complete
MSYFRTLTFIFLPMTGTVKFFNGSKGYGFITNDETGKDIFVHATSLNGVELNEGDKVEYQEEEGRKGMVAAQVQVIG